MKKIRNQTIRMVCFVIIGIVTSLMVVAHSFLDTSIFRGDAAQALFISGIVLPFILMYYTIRLCDDTSQVVLPIASVSLILFTIGVFLFTESLCELLKLPVYHAEYAEYTLNSKNVVRSPHLLYVGCTISFCIVECIITTIVVRLGKRGNWGASAANGVGVTGPSQSMQSMHQPAQQMQMPMSPMPQALVAPTAQQPQHGDGSFQRAAQSGDKNSDYDLDSFLGN